MKLAGFMKNKFYHGLKPNGMETIYLYGIAFHKKICKIICEYINYKDTVL